MDKKKKKEKMLVSHARNCVAWCQRKRGYVVFRTLVRIGKARKKKKRRAKEEPEVWQLFFCFRSSGCISQKPSADPYKHIGQLKCTHTTRGPLMSYYRCNRKKKLKAQLFLRSAERYLPTLFNDGENGKLWYSWDRKTTTSLLFLSSSLFTCVYVCVFFFFFLMYIHKYTHKYVHVLPCVCRSRQIHICWEYDLTIESNAKQAY